MFKGPRYTESELMARLKFTVGLSLAFTLTGIVFITPIATFLTGILSGIMLGKTEEKKEEKSPEAPLPPSAPETPMEKLADVAEEVDDHIA